MNAAVFAISPDSLFQIQPYALSAIAASSIASGLGIATDAWFLLRYNWINLETFIVRYSQLLLLQCMFLKLYRLVPCTRRLWIIFLFRSVFQSAYSVHVRVCYRFDGFSRFCCLQGLATGRLGRMLSCGICHDHAIPYLRCALGHK